MEAPEINKPNLQHPQGFPKPFGRIMVGLLVLMLAGAATYYVLIVRHRFTAKQVSTTEDILEKGTYLEDERNDFVPMEGKEASGELNNPNPYPLPHLDIKGLTLAADDTFLYIKEEFWGKFPSSQETFDGDKIVDVGIKLNLVDEGGTDQTIINSNISFLPFSIVNFGHYIMTDSTGIEWPEDERFASQTTSGLIHGKVGLDYILLAIPKDQLVPPIGEVIYVTLSAEARSQKYVHASVDVLAGEGKNGAIFKVDLTNNSYDIWERK